MARPMPLVAPVTIATCWSKCPIDIDCYLRNDGYKILKKALSLSPMGFENFVIALLEAMGYGRAGSIQRTSATGDAGIDGIISQNPLGLDRIYVQAKRYATDRTVDRPKIHEFAGALLGKQGDRGVFITTSRFSPERLTKRNGSTRG